MWSYVLDIIIHGRNIFKAYLANCLVIASIPRAATRIKKRDKIFIFTKICIYILVQMTQLFFRYLFSLV